MLYVFAEVRMTKDTVRTDNPPFLGGDAAPPSPRSQRRKNRQNNSPCSS